MPVRLQLNDGTVREYPVVNPVKGGFPSITKCGAKDCEHLDCALDLARNLKGTFQSLVWGTVALAVLMIIAFLMLNFLFGRGIASVDLPDLLLIIAPVILILVVYFSSGKRLERHSAAVKELEEYTGYRTINGIPAHQILTAPAAVTGVKPVPPGTRPGILGEMFRTSLVTDLFGNTEYEFRLLQKEPFVHAVRFFAVLLAIFSVLSIITSNLMASFPVFYSWTGRTLDSGPVSLFIHFLGLFAFSFLLVFLNGAWLHVWVFLFGGRSGMRETLRLVLYGSMPALLIGWIPEVGSFIGGLLSLGLYYHGITVFHSLSHGRS
ncbi:MAG TPA: Yip1 family protein, partial [Methanomicrobiales archaeon]|nr:Yip1 family protein [Methanomicrobiales archaeon]